MNIKTDIRAGAKLPAWYTVKRGDNLSYISAMFYGDESFDHVMKIYYANSKTIGANPNVIQPGMVLYIPVV